MSIFCVILNIMIFKFVMFSCFSLEMEYINGPLIEGFNLIGLEGDSITPLLLRLFSSFQPNEGLSLSLYHSPWDDRWGTKFGDVIKSYFQKLAGWGRESTPLPPMRRSYPDIFIGWLLHTVVVYVRQFIHSRWMQNGLHQWEGKRELCCVGIQPLSYGIQPRRGGGRERERVCVWWNFGVYVTHAPLNLTFNLSSLHNNLHQCLRISFKPHIALLFSRTNSRSLRRGLHGIRLQQIEWLSMANWSRL